MSAKQIEEIVEAESGRPRIGKVVFYGICEFCDRKIDVSNKLEFNRKIELINNFGVKKEGNDWVCNHNIALQTCPFCKNVPF